MKSMKNIVAIAATALTLILAGCAKDGIQGPTGPAGTNGTNGTNGANGTNGNANVKVFYFGSDSLSSSTAYYKFLHIKGSVIDSSLVLAYYQDHNYSGAWYACPGLGYAANFQTRFYTYNRTDSVEFDMIAYTPDGSTLYAPTVHLDKVKIVVVPGSTFGKKDPVDYSDYKATMTYYHLPE